MNWKRREFLKTAAGCSLLSLLPRSGLFAAPAGTTRPPNVLFLFSDQHNADALGFTGNPNAFTPNLDRLAGRGTRFERAYCNDGICAPSRNSIFTGQYPRTIGIHDNAVFEASALDRWTPLQRAFKRAGYFTFTTGKRHLLHKVDTDWDYAAGDLKSEVHDTINYWGWLQQQGLTVQAKADFAVELGGPEHAAHFGCKISQLPPQATMEAFAANQTIQFLKSPQAKQKPFFAWSTFYRPHQPYTPQQSYVDQIDFAKLRLPATLWQNADELPPLVQALRHRTTPPWDLVNGDEASYRRYVGYYHALVREVDHHIGSIWETLEQEGLAENTIIVYASDHGDFVGGHGLIEKAAAAQCYYEEVLRVPLLFHWPGKITSGMVSQELVELVDLYPTIMELCELPLPRGYTFPGRSLAPTLRRGAPSGRKYVVAENWGQATVIAADYKYGQWVNSPLAKYDERSFGNMLMQRSTDPGEIKNLIADPRAAATLRQMQGYLAEWLTKTDDAGRREFVATKCKGMTYQPI